MIVLTEKQATVLSYLTGLSHHENEVVFDRRAMSRECEVGYTAISHHIMQLCHKGCLEITHARSGVRLLKRVEDRDVEVQAPFYDPVWLAQLGKAA